MNYSSDLAHAIRFLSVDAVEAAQSGHPGMPLGMADIATVLWKTFLKHNPQNPRWFNRDRFVLSNGHGSMLLYSLLHLTGYKLSMQALKAFRQLHSKTPGHPECTETPGVETTTGPLGQGLANAVGMAIAEKMLATQFNETDLPPLVDHFTYVFVGDGCLMEGISHEAASLAGALGLGKLIVLYDDNGISIDGPVDTWFSDDTASRFRAYHWHVSEAIDGHDFNAIEQAIHQARAVTDKPSLIRCKTIIGYGSLAAGSEKTHGAPLGADDIAQLRQKWDWPHAPFTIPDTIYAAWNHGDQGQADEQHWLETCQQYEQHDTARYHEFLRRINGDLPDTWHQDTDTFLEKCLQSSQAMASRKTSQACIEHFANDLPELLGGSADLSCSNNTDWSGTHAITREDFSGNYINYGVREFGMAAIMNGLAAHGGFIPYGGTFLVFSDYARNAMRLSAMMKLRVIYVLTHDSIGLGEDGPTHQPVEHLAMLRLTPNMRVWRPADQLETAVAWQQALQRHYGPSCLILSRQNLPVLPHQKTQIDMIARGAYIVQDSQDHPELILIATGSEVQIAIEAAQQLSQDNIAVRVISMPCPEQFLAQEASYQEQLLPHDVRRRVAIEASATHYWYRFVGIDGAVVGLDRFGASAPATKIYQDVNITVQHTLQIIKTLF